MIHCELECSGCGASGVFGLSSLPCYLLSEAGGFLPEGVVMYGRGLRDGMLVAKSGGRCHQPWTCHGLHESWQGRCRESFRIHGQPASADVGDSCYFLGSADVGRSRRCFSDISLNRKSQRKLDKYMRCNDWNIINETIRAQGLANAHI